MKGRIGRRRERRQIPSPPDGVPLNARRGHHAAASPRDGVPLTDFDPMTRDADRVRQERIDLNEADSYRAVLIDTGHRTGSASGSTRN